MGQTPELATENLTISVEAEPPTSPWPKSPLAELLARVYKISCAVSDWPKYHISAAYIID